jgi:hypothetical protein
MTITAPQMPERKHHRCTPDHTKTVLTKNEDDTSRQIPSLPTLPTAPPLAKPLLSLWATVFTFRNLTIAALIATAVGLIPGSPCATIPKRRTKKEGTTDGTEKF